MIYDYQKPIISYNHMSNGFSGAPNPNAFESPKMPGDPVPWRFPLQMEGLSH